MKKIYGWTAAVCMAAVILLAGQQVFLSEQTARLNALQTAVEESMAAWHATDEAKITLQEELTQTSNALREAELTLEENTARIIQLKEEITVLTDELAVLTAEKEALAGQNERMTAANAALAAYLELYDAK